MKKLNLGKNLKNAREKAGYSQNDVAEKLNISRQSVSRWEKGRSVPDVENLVVLSQMYKISLDDLLENPSTEHTPLESEKKNYDDFLAKTEHLFIVAIALLSCLAPVIGFFLSVGLFVYCLVKKVHLSTICWIVLVFCIIINISNAYTVISVEIPNWGRGSIEKIN